VCHITTHQVKTTNKHSLIMSDKTYNNMVLVSDKGQFGDGVYYRHESQPQNYRDAALGMTSPLGVLMPRVPESVIPNVTNSISQKVDHPTENDLMLAESYDDTIKSRENRSKSNRNGTIHIVFHEPSPNDQSDYGGRFDVISKRKRANKRNNNKPRGVMLNGVAFTCEGCGYSHCKCEYDDYYNNDYYDDYYGDCDDDCDDDDHYDGVDDEYFQSNEFHDMVDKLVARQDSSDADLQLENRRMLFYYSNAKGGYEEDMNDLL
jgi:hypothetical protein